MIYVLVFPRSIQIFEIATSRQIANSSQLNFEENYTHFSIAPISEDMFVRQSKRDDISEPLIFSLPRFRVKHITPHYWTIQRRIKSYKNFILEQNYFKLITLPNLTKQLKEIHLKISIYRQATYKQNKCTKCLFTL